MTAVLLTQPRIRFLDSNGAPLAGGKIFTYLAGTTTPQATYTNAGAGTPNANPVILDSAGYADIWISGAYKIVVQDSAGNTISTTDNITAFTTGAVGATFLDGSLTVQNTSDPTKQFVFNLAGITTGTTITGTVPNGNFTFVDPALPQTWTAAQIEAISTITYGATTTPNFALGNNFQLQLTGSPTIANPTTPTAGQTGYFYVYQDATGSRIPTWGWGYLNPGGSLPTLQTAGGSLDILKYAVTAYNSAVVTVSIATPGVVTFTNHGFFTGQQIQITTTGALPTGLSASTTYYVIYVDANTFSLATTLANAAAGTKINTTGTQSGIHTLTGLTIDLTTPKTAAATGGYRALAGSDTVVATDNGKTLTVSGTCALALTAASSIGAFSCFIQNTATTGIQIITVTPNGTDNIDGANSTLIMLPGEIREWNCNATAWTTEVVVPFTLNITSTATPTLPRNGYVGVSGQLWGGGGSGGAGATNGGGGGGGGGYNNFIYTNTSGGLIPSLALTCTIGAGGGSQTSANTAGSSGSATSVVTAGGITLGTAYGGGAGAGASLGAGGGGGSTGWGASNTGAPTTTGIGANGVTTTAGTGGKSWDQQTAAAASTSPTGQYGGAGGGNSTNSGAGASSLYGGGGGAASVATTGGAGGSCVYGAGGGGGASNVTGGAGGVSALGYNGGAGGSNGAGTNGGTGGGGGGGAVGTAGSGAGGGGRIILQGIN